MARINEAAVSQHAEWTYLSNFFGKKRGGQRMPESSPFHLEAFGTSDAKVAARCSLKNGSVESAPQSKDTSATEQEFPKNKQSLSLIGWVFPGVRRTFRARAIFVGLMILCRAGCGGGVVINSIPALNPTKNNHAERVVDGLQESNSKPDLVRLESAMTKLSDDIPSVGRLSFSTETEIGDQYGHFLMSMNQNPSKANEVKIPATALEMSLGGKSHNTAELHALMSHKVSEVKHAHVISELRALSDDCINLTIAIMPYSFEGTIGWSLDVITEGGNDTVWSRNYSDPDLAITVIIEHSQESDSNGESLCFPPGKYKFSHHPDGMPYVLYSEGTLVECGLYDYSIFVLPFNSSDPSTCYDAVDDWGGLAFCPNITCSDVEGKDDCVNMAMEPIHCFYLGWEKENGGNRTAWFADNCAKIFDDVCQSTSLDVEHDHIGFFHQQFVEIYCPFFQCAYPAYQSYMEGGTLEEYHGCNCLYEQSICPNCSQAECCFDGGSEKSTESDIVRSCICVIEPLCNIGNVEMCDVALEFCCPVKLDLEERMTCEQTALHYTCQDSIKHNNNNGDLSVCHRASSAKCDDDEDTYGCECRYWETLCTENAIHGSVCEEAVGYCCGSISQNQCRCDFYNNALKFGYVSDQIDSSCDGAFAEQQDHSNIVMYQYYAKKIADSLGSTWWFNNDGWQDDKTSHCHWFGVTCNEAGFISQINLKGNNLTGELTYVDDDGSTQFSFNHLYDLEMLDLSDNNIFGSIRNRDYFNLRQLLHVDLSGNELTGVADILLSPLIRHLNLSHNKFSSVGYMIRSYSAYESIEVIDIGHNSLEQPASAVFGDLPPSLKGLYISENFITGTFPNPFPAVSCLKHFHAARNQLTGSLIEFLRSMPRVFTIDLSNQKHSGGRGLYGSLPLDIPSLLDLLELNLSGNRLIGTIPVGIANIPRLQLLNLSKNAFSGKIPSKLGQLAVVLEVLDLSSNAFTGTIPQEFKDFRGLVLVDNNRLSYPAPLGLCYDVPGFDLNKHSGFCPPERNALNDFFISAKGLEWTNSSLWGDQFAMPCSWYGIECNESSNKIVSLNLTNNGLGGFLNGSVGNITSLRMLDLSDNDIKGRIPKELFLLSNLTSLRLSFNQFSGTVPVQLANLINLELAQLHSNWLTGEIHLNSQFMKDPSSFTADCGVPSDFDKPIICRNCTICCNLRGECQSTELPRVLSEDTPGFRDYKELSWYHKSHSLTRAVSGELIEDEKHYALNTVGHETVYSFFLTKSWAAWTVAISVIAFQFVVFWYFVSAAEKDFADEKSDFVYAWRCPRNNPVCKNDDDRSSTVYNSAIARTNSELVANAVIVLFITDVDEQMYFLLESMTHRWLENLITGITTHPGEPPENAKNGSSREKVDITEKAGQPDLQKCQADFDASLQQM
ncbi:hypothetical protein ACHAWX_006963, partial [Stephanocyclus meneghinianus]